MRQKEVKCVEVVRVCAFEGGRKKERKKRENGAVPGCSFPFDSTTSEQPSDEDQRE